MSSWTDLCPFPASLTLFEFAPVALVGWYRTPALLLLHPHSHCPSVKYLACAATFSLPSSSGPGPAAAVAPISALPFFPSPMLLRLYFWPLFGVLFADRFPIAIMVCQFGSCCVNLLDRPLCSPPCWVDTLPVDLSFSIVYYCWPFWPGCPSSVYFIAWALSPDLLHAPLLWVLISLLFVSSMQPRYVYFPPSFSFPVSRYMYLVGMSVLWFRVAYVCIVVVCGVEHISPLVLIFLLWTSLLCVALISTSICCWILFLLSCCVCLWEAEIRS